MSQEIDKLENKSYDVLIERELVNHYNRRINLYKDYFTNTKDLNSQSEARRNEILEELIRKFEEERPILESVNDSIKIRLMHNFGYNIDNT